MTQQNDDQIYARLEAVSNDILTRAMQAADPHPEPAYEQVRPSVPTVDHALESAIRERLEIEALVHQAWMRAVIHVRGNATPTGNDTLRLRSMLTAIDEMART